MKNEQISVDVVLMFKTALIYLSLALSGWLLLRLVQVCIWFPAHLKAQQKYGFDQSLWRKDYVHVNGEKFIGKKTKPLKSEIDEKSGAPCPAPVSRIKVEKVDGGLVVAGVVVAANCQIALPVFGCLFVIVGIVLTVASYRGPGQDEEPENYAARLAFTGNSRILGPACIAVGLVMLSAGIILCILAKRARQRQRRIGFHCPIHGDFYPLSPVIASKSKGVCESRWGLCFGRTQSLGLEEISRSFPQCPHTQLSSARSSFSSAPISPCPTPMPFLVTSNSVSDLVIAVESSLSPDHTFGSIRSLSASREVASFPLSRTPSPPHQFQERLCSLTEPTAVKYVITCQAEGGAMSNKCNKGENNNTSYNGNSHLLVAKFSEKPVEQPLFTKNEICSAEKSSEKKYYTNATKSSRKSVSIVLPSDNGMLRTAIIQEHSV